MIEFQYLIFDFIQGADLFTLLEAKKFKPMAEAHVKKIIRQVALTLHKCHQQGIAHHDVKLENVSPS